MRVFHRTPAVTALRPDLRSQQCGAKARCAAGPPAWPAPATAGTPRHHRFRPARGLLSASCSHCHSLATSASRARSPAELSIATLHLSIVLCSFYNRAAFMATPLHELARDFLGPPHQPRDAFHPLALEHRVSLVASAGATTTMMPAACPPARAGLRNRQRAARLRCRGPRTRSSAAAQTAGCSDSPASSRTSAASSPFPRRPSICPRGLPSAPRRRRPAGR